MDRQGTLDKNKVELDADAVAEEEEGAGDQ